MSFSNPIVAGEELIRSAIKSENYSTGSAGWRIARDGNSEFNNVTIRGDLNVIGNDPPDEYIRIYQALGVPTIEWSTADGVVFESYAVDDSSGVSYVKITSSNSGGLYVLSTGEVAMIGGNAGGQSVIFDPDINFLNVAFGILAPVKEEWHVLPLQNGWEQNGEVPEYRLMPDGTVLLRGNMDNGVTANGTVVGTLPVGYRPVQAHRQILAEKATGVDYRHVRVSTNGEIDVWKANTANLCIDGLRFPVI